MTDLETKRNAIMNSASGGGWVNLLENVNWQHGYVKSDGTINPNTSQQEMCYADYVEIDEQNIYLIQFQTPNSTSGKYLYVSFYDENKNFLSSKVISSTLSSNNLLQVREFMPVVNAKYVRITAKTFGLMNISLVENQDVTMSVEY